MRITGAFPLVMGAFLVAAWPAGAADQPAYKGIWVSTPYPSMTVAAGEAVRLNVSVHSVDVPPERADLKLDGVPKGWSATFFGKGKPVEAVFVGPKETTDLQLRIEPGKGVASGTYHFGVVAAAGGDRFELPVDLTVAQALPPKLKAEADFPSLRGSPTSSFEYPLHVTNESDHDALVALSASAPAGFQVTFAERYGTQEMTSVAVKAGEKQDLKAKVALPSGIEAGTYKMDVNATAEGVNADLPLKLEVTGQPNLTLSAPGDLLSGHAYAGEEAPMDLIVHNTGSAAAHKVKLGSSEPTGWKVDFKPDQIDAIAPDAVVKVKALVTPAAKAIAGDYMVTFRTSGEGAAAHSDFRVTVRTSTMWGIVGVLVIASALIILVFAVRRYGRR